MSTEQRFTFGPLERQGVLAGLRGGQLAAVAAGLASAVLLVRAWPSIAGFGSALAALGLSLAIAFVPVAGRTLEEWLPVLGVWIVQRFRRRNRWRSALPLLGHVDGLPDPDPPDTLRRVRLLAAPFADRDGEPVGVIHDRAAGTYAAVLAVRGRSLALADQADRTRRLQTWGSTLSSLARAGSPVARLQWIDRTVPDDGDAMGRYLAEAATVASNDPSLRSYLELVDGAGPATQQHETLLVVSMSASKARRSVRAAGGGDEGACKVLLREVQALRRQLARGDVRVDGVLSPRTVARAQRTAFDPRARVDGNRRTAAGAQEGVDPGNAWPLATEVSWQRYRTADVWHATYWVAQWPRIPVGSDFLAPLLLGTTAMRTVSLTMEPIDPLRATREVENAVVQGMADDELRARHGFLASARQRRERESVARREEELASGHAEFRIAGFVTVTAGDDDALEVACGEVEQAAQQARLELRRLYGQQDEAFTWTLPLARGLA